MKRGGKGPSLPEKTERRPGPSGQGMKSASWKIVLLLFSSQNRVGGNKVSHQGGFSVIFINFTRILLYLKKFGNIFNVAAILHHITGYLLSLVKQTINKLPRDEL